MPTVKNIPELVNGRMWRGLDAIEFSVNRFYAEPENVTMKMHGMEQSAIDKLSASAMRDALSNFGGKPK
jgi:hypothetical protein